MYMIYQELMFYNQDKLEDCIIIYDKIDRCFSDYFKKVQICYYIFRDINLINFEINSNMLNKEIPLIGFENYFG